MHLFDTLDIKCLTAEFGSGGGNIPSFCINFRKCLTVQVCQTTSENIRRNNINIHQMVQNYGNCDTENGNEHRAVHDGYSDPWEIRHNIVQQGELQQQNTIMEETET